MQADFFNIQRLFTSFQAAERKNEWEFLKIATRRWILQTFYWSAFFFSLL